MKPRPWLTGVVLLMMAAIGCTSGSGLAGTSNSTPDAPGATPGPINSPGQPTDLAWIYEAPYDPINLTTTLEESGKAEAVIPVEGGMVTATGADGTSYTLEIPADALLVETLVSLTPVQSLDGLPFGAGSAFAVQLAPEGLAFNNYVTLTITPAQPIPLAEQIMFDFQADGEALGLALPAMDPGTIQIHLLHFSGAGVSKGLLADLEPVRQRLGGSVEARLQSAMAAAVQQARQNGEAMESLWATLSAYFNEYVERVVKPRLAAAGESCAAGRLAIETILSVERQRQLLGLADENSSLMSELVDLMEPVGQVCLKEEYELCRDEHIVHRIATAWLSVLRQLQLFGIDSSALEAEGREYVERCLSFDLELESTAVAEQMGASFESRVTSEVPLRAKVDGYSVTIEGEGPANNETFAVSIPGCSAVTSRGGGTFAVIRLNFDVATSGAGDQLGAVRDLHLSYDPGTTSESYTLTCQGMSVPAARVLWSEMFIVAHESDIGSERLLAQDWEVLGGEEYARKEWELTAIVEGGTVTEIGSFKLYHRPQ